MKPISRNELLEALRQYGKAQAKRPPGDGWQTLEDLAREETAATGQPVSVPAMRYRLEMAQKRGIRFESAPGTALDAEGNARRATYWRVVKNGKP